MSLLPASFADACVLVADACPHARRNTRGLLGAQGLRCVLEAADGIALLAIAAATRPRAVVMDWDLPLIDGRHAARLLRDPAASHDPMVPIVALSARPTGAMVRAAAELAVDHVLLKPASPRELWRRVEMCLLRRAERWAPPRPAPPSWELA